MTTKKTLSTPVHTASLADEEQMAALIKRVKRASGQLNAVVRMLEEGRPCPDVVTQMSAVSKAVHTAAFTLIASKLQECLREPDEHAADATQQLQKLFLQLA
ncbi:MAG: metal-sensitive transcriptional regulator [Acidobacteria bacterium]|nr:metal-sensitive transcriptional regulator [Acidobacteriota bacterium]